MHAPEVKEGAILVAQWGYIDRLVDFYLVLKRTAKTVTLRKLQNRDKRVTHKEPGGTIAEVVPTKKFVEPRPDDKDDPTCQCSQCISSREFRKKVHEDGSVHIEDYRIAELWDGKPVERKTGYY